MGEEDCYDQGSVALFVVGTFLGTCGILLVAAFVYRKWRRHIGKHLVLVTDPEIVDEAYAFDNPCFRDITANSTTLQQTQTSSRLNSPTVNKENRWLTSWPNLGLPLAGRAEKRKTVDDSCLNAKPSKISVVGLKSRDFTGLGFNVCGNMREGIFVKDLLHRGPASESGLIHPGDRIMSIKISFQSMVYEDALTILSYASPYDVEVEVQTGGAITKPTTLLKKAAHNNCSTKTPMCHPLFRSQSIPELSSRPRRATSKHNGDVNDSNYSTMNSTMKSSKSTPGVQTLERQNAKAAHNNQPHHFKFGIKVLPALDGTIHRIENQNEHNTNLERRNSKKTKIINEITSEKYVKLQDETFAGNGIDVTDCNRFRPIKSETNIEVPEEVQNAGEVARKNRKSVAEVPPAEPTTPPVQKNKRKAPSPPAVPANVEKTSPGQLNGDSDTDTELQNSFTTIELDAAQITIHHTPVSEMELDRKVSSLGDLSKFKAEARSGDSALFERAKSLDMNDVSLKKRKLSSNSEKASELVSDDAPDLQVSQVECKLKKSSDWGKLEDFVEVKTSTPLNTTLSHDLDVEKALSDFEASLNFDDDSTYSGKSQVIEEPITKVVVNYTCPGCQRRTDGSHHHDCVPESPQKPLNRVSSIKIGGDSTELESDLPEDQPTVVEKPNNYVTEIKVFNNNQKPEVVAEAKQVITIREKSDPMANSLGAGSAKNSEKPPVPPRRSDIAKLIKGEKSNERQIVYISDYKSRLPANNSIVKTEAPEVREEKIKDFKNWVFENDGK